MTDTMATQVERQFPRLSRQGKIGFKVIENAKNLLMKAGVPESQFQNISGGGIRFHSREPVSPGTFLAVRIELPELPDSIIAFGRVVTCEPPALTESRSEIAVEFFWTGWGARAVESTIHQFINERV
jgi:hypothetical protein